MAKYKHTGTQPIVVEPGAKERHIQPGEMFDAAFDPAHEAFLLKIGAIAKADPAPEPAQE